MVLPLETFIYWFGYVKTEIVHSEKILTLLNKINFLRYYFSIHPNIILILKNKLNKLFFVHSITD